MNADPVDPGATTGDLRLVAYDADDAAEVLAGLEIVNAAYVVDSPWRPPRTPYRQTEHVRRGWSAATVHHYLALDGEVPVALGELEINDYDNRDFGWAELVVHPAHRRRGHGTRVLAHLADRARELGCTKLGTAGWDTPGLAAFAERVGMRAAAIEAYRVQHLDRLPAGLAQEAYDEAAPRASDYELVRIAGRTPEHLLDAVVELTAAINDAPVGELEIEDEVFSRERIVRYEQGAIDCGHRFYRLLARHRDTGELGGHSVVAVDTDRPWMAFQHDTSVAQAHRGHRLGLLLKADMMRWLADEEPQLTWLATSNSAANVHMVPINERLGYELVGQEIEMQQHL